MTTRPDPQCGVKSRNSGQYHEIHPNLKIQGLFQHSHLVHDFELELRYSSVVYVTERHKLDSRSAFSDVPVIKATIITHFSTNQSSWPEDPGGIGCFGLSRSLLEIIPVEKFGDRWGRGVLRIALLHVIQPQINCSNGYWNWWTWKLCDNDSNHATFARFVSIGSTTIRLSMDRLQYLDRRYGPPKILLLTPIGGDVISHSPL